MSRKESRATTECVNCRPALVPECSPKAAFGVQSHVGYAAFLDGVDVSRECYRGCAGKDGWVLLYAENGAPKGMCPDGRHPYAVLRRGRVEIQLR